MFFLNMMRLHCTWLSFHAISDTFACCGSMCVCVHACMPVPVCVCVPAGVLARERMTTAFWGASYKLSNNNITAARVWRNRLLVMVPLLPIRPHIKTTAHPGSSQGIAVLSQYQNYDFGTIPAEISRYRYWNDNTTKTQNIQRTRPSAKDVYWAVCVLSTLVHYCSLHANNPGFELHHARQVNVLLLLLLLLLL